jgi:NTE family protein
MVGAALTSSTHWWRERSAVVNGIFKGGGAKGLLYAGALRAVDTRGFWFRASAGSSAGAITATLIAAGLRVDELEQAVPEALSHIHKNRLADLRGKAFIRTEKLEEWLEQRLRAQLQHFGFPSSLTPVSFGDLVGATGIELNIVAVDVATRQPIVFNAATAPTVSVARAALASSAIPLAFRPGRLEVEHADGTTAVHRLMDGGVWANYPAFVFKDRSFRAFHDLAAVPAESITVGFTLEHSDPEPPARPKSLLPWANAASDRGALLRGWLRPWPIRLYLFTFAPLVIALQAAYTIDKYGLLFLSDWIPGSGVPDVLEDVAGFTSGFVTHFWLGLVPAFIFLGLIAVLLALLGATLLDSGFPAMKTLMAVGTNVPYWVGTTPGDHVVRLPVPDGLDTMTFSPDLSKVPGWIDDAEQVALTQLKSILPADQPARPSQT